MEGTTYYGCMGLHNVPIPAGSLGCSIAKGHKEFTEIETNLIESDVRCNLCNKVTSGPLLPVLFISWRCPIAYFKLGGFILCTHVNVGDVKWDRAVHGVLLKDRGPGGL